VIAIGRNWRRFRALRDGYSQSLCWACFTMLWNAARTWAAIRERNRHRPAAATRWTVLQRILPIVSDRPSRESARPMPLTSRTIALLEKRAS
jgi:hypothetical protein